MEKKDLKVHNRNLDINNVEQSNEIALVGRALSSPIRLEILRLIIKKPLLVSEISQILNLQLSSAAFHLKVLEDANMVKTHYSTKGKNSLKYYSYAPFKMIMIKTREAENNEIMIPPYYSMIKIGDYIDVKFNSECGMASETTQILGNNPNDIFINERHDAQIIWNSGPGYLVYALANSYAVEKTLKSIELSLEICSEAYGYNHDFPSDITFSVNGVELYTWTCPGDYGDHYGKYTPSWWFIESTKYGDLVRIKVKKEGVYFNDKLVNREVTLAKLNLAEGNRTEFKIEVKKDARYCGGFNIFGDKFGNYNQDINFVAEYEKN